MRSTALETPVQRQTAAVKCTPSKAGDWVRVKSKDEILKTLDKNGRLEGLPFMPQMFKYCGQKVQVYKRAHKTCDTIAGMQTGYIGRKIPDGVHLEFRCDGKAHGGCQADCLLFWKEAWLEHVDETSAPPPAPVPLPPQVTALVPKNACTEDDVMRATRKQTEGGEPLYACQATELHAFSTPLKWWDARQYVEDYRSGNTSLFTMLRTLVYVTFYYGSLAHRYRLGRPARWLYGNFMKLVGGSPMRRTRGKLPLDKPAPRSDLNLAPGDLVRVKSFEDILNTINVNNSNRGLSFDAEMVMFCGKTHRVRTSVERFIDEATGRMKTLKTPAVILEGGFCRGCYSEQRFFCPRGIFAWWREVWLEKVPEEAGLTGDPCRPRHVPDKQRRSA
jgi:hypothetical protein